MSKITGMLYHWKFIHCVKGGERDCLKGMRFSDLRKLISQEIIQYNKMNDAHIEILVNMPNFQNKVYYISIFFGKVIENYWKKI